MLAITYLQRFGTNIMHLGPITRPTCLGLLIVTRFNFIPSIRSPYKKNYLVRVPYYYFLV